MRKQNRGEEERSPNIGTRDGGNSGEAQPARIDSRGVRGAGVVVGKE